MNIVGCLKITVYEGVKEIFEKGQKNKECFSVCFVCFLNTFFGKVMK